MKYKSKDQNQITFNFPLQTHILNTATVDLPLPPEVVLRVRLRTRIWKDAHWAQNVASLISMREGLCNGSCSDTIYLSVDHVATPYICKLWAKRRPMETATGQTDNSRAPVCRCTFAHSLRCRGCKKRWCLRLKRWKISVDIEFKVLQEKLIFFYLKTGRWRHDFLSSGVSPSWSAANDSRSRLNVPSRWI